MKLERMTMRDNSLIYLIKPQLLNIKTEKEIESGATEKTFSKKDFPSADQELEISKRKFFLHRFVLNQRAPLIYTDENSKILQEISPGVAKVFLRWMYSGFMDLRFEEFTMEELILLYQLFKNIGVNKTVITYVRDFIYLEILNMDVQDVVKHWLHVIEKDIEELHIEFYNSYTRRTKEFDQLVSEMKTILSKVSDSIKRSARSSSAAPPIRDYDVKQEYNIFAQNLLKEKPDSDIKILTYDNKYVYAHYAVIHLRFPFFNKLVDNKSAIIHLKDYKINHDALQYIIDYVYFYDFQSDIGTYVSKFTRNFEELECRSLKTMIDAFITLVDMPRFQKIYSLSHLKSLLEEYITSITLQQKHLMSYLKSYIESNLGESKGFEYLNNVAFGLRVKRCL